MYLNIKQAAEKLNVSVRTVRRMMADGKLKYYKLSVRCVRFDPNDIDEFVKSQTRCS